MRQGESERGTSGRGASESLAGTTYPRALFLVLFGLTLAVLWVVFGTSHSASAEEAPAPAPAAPAPSLLGSVASTVDSVVAAVAPLQSAIVAPVVPAADHTAPSPVPPTSLPVTAVVAPISNTVDAVVAAVPVVPYLTGSAPVSTATAPLSATLDGVLGPVLDPVLGALLTDVVGPILTPALGSGGIATGSPFPIVDGVVASTESTSSTAVAARASGVDIHTSTLLQGHALSTAGSSALAPLTPPSPFSPVGGPSAERSIGMLSGSSSAGAAATVAAGALGGFALPARLVRASAALAADDSLPSSLTLDPGSSPD